MHQNEGAIHTFRPALIPDNRRLVWYPLAICGVVAALGYLFANLLLVIMPLLVVAVFPGLPIAIHSVYFLSIQMTLDGDKLTIVDWAGDPFVSYPRRQEIVLSRVAYLYHLKKEAEANMTKSAPPPPFCNTFINTKKYRAADKNPRRIGVVARTNNGLVLSDKNGENKVYIMHFHDLSQKDWQKLAGEVQKRNGEISFLMNDKEKKGVLGQSA